MRVALLLPALHADFLLLPLLLLLQQIKDHTGTPVAAAAIVSRGASGDVAQYVCAQCHLFFIFRTVSTFTCQSVTVFFLLCQSGHIHTCMHVAQQPSRLVYMLPCSPLRAQACMCPANPKHMLHKSQFMSAELLSL